MTNYDKLLDAVTTAYGKQASILDSTDSKVIIRFEKNEIIEYAVLSHNFKTVFNGKYYSTQGQSQDKARNAAWKTYESYAKTN
ncbi:hypothetical protein M4L90_12310 [Staphylococcus equorum]|uniref:Uncharacterized protein n=1 Tax=Staphylococcus equorum TaxID=246432 RepID=A0A9X4L6J7_9STAP|nr:hypothetical protein [Staphylococcus equorum]MDG0820703.1 hypothetical protein [Staphylococcus equorum]MDG0841328.1 hypothetical protein [Staphylococcus equorum]MDG0847028.1 hypothetical protein [Staphylococcus equorum]OEL08259.1 hypothetical protein AST04_08725 [Staphylococcus equorum]PTE82303.1 hypothetical protein BUY85_00770 [Staphylococcus equorum]